MAVLLLYAIFKVTRCFDAFVGRFHSFLFYCNSHGFYQFSVVVVTFLSVEAVESLLQVTDKNWDSFTQWGDSTMMTNDSATLHENAVFFSSKSLLGIVRILRPLIFPFNALL